MRWRAKFAIVAIGMVAVAPLLWADSRELSVTSSSWTWPPYIIFPLLAAALLYAVGIFRIQRRSQRMQNLPVAFFVAGWSSLLLALDSPVHEISEQLFWVHMTQHEILMLISAPLLVLSQPAGPLLWALPQNWRVRVGAIGNIKIFNRGWLLISAPLGAWLFHAIALWAWHAPVLFIAALENDAIHAAQHISFLGTALLFWWALFHEHSGRLGYGGGILFLFHNP